MRQGLHAPTFFLVKGQIQPVSKHCVTLTSPCAILWWTVRIGVSEASSSGQCSVHSGKDRLSVSDGTLRLSQGIGLGRSQHSERIRIARWDV